MRAPLALIAILLASPAAGRDLPLAPPIDCDLGRTCHIQNYVDRDPGPGAADFTCGPLTYDGHKGTDFALPSLAAMAAGVDVLAAAPGTVTALRDGMPDIAANDPAAPDLAGRDCGNGVVIRHGDGWETQYCHMRQGSIAVAKGQRVAKGAVLGQVGLSGRTEFPHVHLSVRKDGAVVDPFAPGPGPATCGGAPEDTLWQTGLDYAAGGMIAAGAATRVPGYDEIKAGLPPVATLPPDAPALVIWGYAFGARAGDTMTIRIDGPEGEVLAHEAPLEKTQAQVFRAAGKRNPGRWSTGSYTGTVVFSRNGRELGRQNVAFTVAN